MLRPCVALLLLALALPTGSASGASMDVPPLSQGDFWERARDGLVTHETVEGFGSVELGGGTHDAVRIVERVVGLPGAPASEEVRTTWLRASDHAFLRSRVEGEGPARVEEATAPCAQTAWPLKLSASWTVSCTLRQGGAVAQETNLTLHRRVAWEGNLSTWVGPRHVLLVETRAGDADGPVVGREWYAPAACGVVRSESYEDGQTHTTELRAFRCLSAPEEQAPRPPTPDMVDTCSGVPGARCTPGPGVGPVLAALVLVPLLRAKRS